MKIEITNLHARVDDKEVLQGIDLVINPGEVHAIMGPNGSGKSTLSHVIAGRDGYEVTQGAIKLDGKDLLDMDVSERAQAGVFLAFQYPVEIPGVTAMNFLKSTINAVRKARGEDELDAVGVLKAAKEQAKFLGMKEKLLKRAVNSGFSGGEKKRFEILQMMLLEPSFCVLDETDSGLDIDALRMVSEGVNAMRNNDRAMLVITHYQRLLNHIVPDVVHVLAEGKIVKSGGMELAELLEKDGYAALGIKDEQQVTDEAEVA